MPAAVHMDDGGIDPNCRLRGRELKVESESDDGPPKDDGDGGDVTSEAESSRTVTASMRTRFNESDCT